MRKFIIKIKMDDYIKVIINENWVFTKKGDIISILHDASAYINNTKIDSGLYPFEGKFYNYIFMKATYTYEIVDTFTILTNCGDKIGIYNEEEYKSDLREEKLNKLLDE